MVSVENQSQELGNDEIKREQLKRVCSKNGPPRIEKHLLYSETKHSSYKLSERLQIHQAAGKQEGAQIGKQTNEAGGKFKETIMVRSEKLTSELVEQLKPKSVGINNKPANDNNRIGSSSSSYSRGGGRKAFSSSGSDANRPLDLEGNSRRRLQLANDGQIPNDNVGPNANGSLAKAEEALPAWPASDGGRNVCSRRVQQRSQRQQQQPREPAVSQHHYDCCTDSDLASQLAHSQSFNGPRGNDNFYSTEENVQLFATEHYNDSQANSSNLCANSSRQRACTSSNYYLNNPATPTGRFVNYYPSWRQGQPSVSSASRQFINYAFHVPQQQSLAGLSRSSMLHHNQRLNPHHQQQQQQMIGGVQSMEKTGQQRQQLYQARYGFVAPADKLQNSRHETGFNQSFKSRTIAHIPSMIGLSARETTCAAQQREPLMTESSNYEDFYEKPGIMTKQFVLSEGDLLRANLIDVKRTYLPIEDGFDNPFKPETELSWEANMMVRLMKRGYPIQELPILVETAKQIALNKQILREEERGRNEEPNNLVRRQSISDLNSGKHTWANSLSRTKSVPKFSSDTKQEQDADSMDKLIIGIEQEMSQLLAEDRVKQKSDEELIVDGNLVAGAGAKLLAAASNLSKTDNRKVSSDSNITKTKSKNEKTNIRKRKRKSDPTKNANETNLRIEQQVKSGKFREDLTGNRVVTYKSKSRKNLKNGKRERRQRRRACCVVQ